MRPYDDDKDWIPVSKRLVVAIGLNNSIVLRKIDQWCYHNEEVENKDVYRDGFY
jgi:hypothetical protein